VKKAMNSGFVKRAALGAVITGAALAAGSAMAVPAMASTACDSGCPVTSPVWPGGTNMPGGTTTGTTTGMPTGTKTGPTTGMPTGPSTGMRPGTWHLTAPRAGGFGQVAAEPVDVKSPINQLVGTIGAPLVNVNVPCPAPWWQGGVAGAKYNACNTADANQQDGLLGTSYDRPGSGVTGFGQVAAAPVKVDAPVNQLVGTVGAPLVNVNIPCPAPWNQGGVLGAKYNACNTAPVNQQF
jgi:hypothetical protein